MAHISILGQRITWHVVSYSHRYDFDHARATGRSPRVRVENLGAVRTGVVWSAGPVSGTAWVIPDQRVDGEGRAVCVKIEKDGRHVARPQDVERSTAKAHTLALSHRCMSRSGIQDARGAVDVRARVAAAA